VVKVITLLATGLPARSVTAPVWIKTVYLVPLAKVTVGSIVRILSLMLLAVAIVVPLLFLSSIHILPALMASLKVMVMVLVLAMLIAPLVGLDDKITGEVPTLKVLTLLATGLPNRSVTAPV